MNLYKTLLTLVIILLSTVFILFSLSHWIQRNYWSLRYLHSSANVYSNINWSPEILETYPHLRLWLARDQLKKNTIQAQKLIQPLLAQDNKDALRLQGNILYIENKLTDAIAVWSQIDDLASLHRVAKDEMQENRLQNALIAYEAAYKLDPENQSHILAEFLWRILSNTERAEAILQEAVSTYEYSRWRIRWLLILGNLYREERRWDAAANLYEYLIDVEHMYLSIPLGWIYYERGDGIEAALTQFQKAIEEKPKRKEGYFAIGQILSREKHYKQADEWFEQALTRDINPSWDYMSAYAANARNSGNLALALNRYEKALERFPTIAAIHYKIAQIYYQTDQIKSAIISIETGLDLLETSVSVDYYLLAGQIYEKSGDFKHALLAYKRVLHLDPQSATAVQKIKFLSNKVRQ